MAEKRIIRTIEEYEPLTEEEKFTEEEQIEECCHEVSVDECADVGRKVSPYVSMEEEELDLDLDALNAEMEEQYGDKSLGVRLIAVGPSGNCGEKIETWSGRNDCCDEVEPLVYDTDSSVSVLAPGEHGNVYFTGGKFPVFIKVRGNGFSLDGYNQREGWIDGPNKGATIHAHEFACGTAPITLDDGCSVATGSVRSTEGHWDGLCYAYYWELPNYIYEFSSTNYPAEVRDCVYGQVGTDYEYSWKTAAASHYRHVTYRWREIHGWNWYVDSYCSGRLRKEYYDTVVSAMQALGVPEGQDPRDYAPNGPGDTSAVCSVGCRFIC